MEDRYVCPKLYLLIQNNRLKEFVFLYICLNKQNILSACQEVDLRSLPLTQIHSVIQRSSVNVRGRSLTAQSP